MTLWAALPAIAAVVVVLVSPESNAQYYTYRRVSICQSATIYVNSTFETKNLILESPNYNNSGQETNISESCSVTIKADQIVASGRFSTILLTVTSFDLGGQDPCSPSQEHLTIGFPEHCQDGVETIRWCGQSYTNVLSIRRDMQLTYHPGTTGNRGIGFKIRISAGTDPCPPNRRMTVGNQPMYLYSPGYPDNYYNMIRTKCIWTITSSSRGPLMLESLRFALEYHNTCKYDTLDIKIDSYRTRSYCGDQRVWAMIRTGHTEVSLLTDYRFTYKGYILKVVEAKSDYEPCNREVAVSSSPIFLQVPTPYPGKWTLKCWWLFNTGSNSSVVLLDTTQFSTGVGCSQFELWLYDGKNNTARKIAQNCAPLQMFQTVRSSSQYLYLQVDQETYTQEPISVNFTVSASPRDAPPRVLYAGFAPSHVWLDLSTYQDLGILIRGTEEAADNYSTCINLEVKEFPDTVTNLNASDFFFVFSGYNYSFSELVHACGRTSSTSLVSRGSQMYLRFHTSLKTSIHQIWLTYTLLRQRHCQPDTVELTAATSPRSNLNSDSSWCPLAFYPNNVYCRWLIRSAGPDYATVIMVSQSELHEGGKDNMTAYEYKPGTDQNRDNQLLHWSGNATPTVYSSRGSGLLLDFVTDGSGVGSGFSLSYYSVSLSEECPPLAPLTAHSSFTELTSPNYPDYYPNNLDCKWRIYSKIGIVNLTLIHVNLDQGTSRCALNSDSLIIYDGSDESSQVRKQVCGSSGEESFLSSGAYLLIHFHSDSSGSASGFKLKFKAASNMGMWDCNKEIFLRDGQRRFISNPTFPGTYPFPSDAECWWLIRGPPGSTISLTVQRLKNHVCLLVYDGESTSAAGTNKEICSLESAAYSSSANALYMRLQHNSYDLDHMSFAFAVTVFYHDGCNGKPLELLATNSREYIESPSYPIKYPPYSDCAWLILAMNDGEVIKLEVFDMRLEVSKGCSTDSVKVYDGKMGPLLRTMCNDQNEPIVSSGKVMYVQFTSDMSVQEAGFRLAYFGVSESEALPKADSQTSHQVTGAVVGGVIGGVVILLMAVTLLICFVRHRHRSQNPHPGHASRQTSRDGVGWRGGGGGGGGGTVFVMSPVIVNQLPPPPYSDVFRSPGYASSSSSAHDTVAPPPVYEETEAPPPYSEHMLDSFPPSSPLPALQARSSSQQPGTRDREGGRERSLDPGAPGDRASSSQVSSRGRGSVSAARAGEPPDARGAPPGDHDGDECRGRRHHHHQRQNPAPRGVRHGSQDSRERNNDDDDDNRNNSSSLHEHADSYSNDAEEAVAESGRTRAPRGGQPQRHHDHHQQQGRQPERPQHQGRRAEGPHHQGRHPQQQQHSQGRQPEQRPHHHQGRQPHQQQSQGRQPEQRPHHHQGRQPPQQQQGQTTRWLSEAGEHADGGGYPSSLLARMDSDDPGGPDPRRGSQQQQHQQQSRQQRRPQHHRGGLPSTPPPPYQPTSAGPQQQARLPPQREEASETGDGVDDDDGGYASNLLSRMDSYTAAVSAGPQQQARPQPQREASEAGDGVDDDDGGYASNLLSRTDSYPAATSAGALQQARPQPQREASEADDNGVEDDVGGYASNLLSRMDSSYASDPDSAPPGAAGCSRARDAPADFLERQHSTYV